MGFLGEMETRLLKGLGDAASVFGSVFSVSDDAMVKFVC